VTVTPCVGWIAVTPDDEPSAAGCLPTGLVALATPGARAKRGQRVAYFDARCVAGSDHVFVRAEDVVAVVSE